MKSALRRGAMLLVAALLFSGCYSFKAAHKDIDAKEAELKRLNAEIDKEKEQENAMKKDPLLK